MYKQFTANFLMIGILVTVCFDPDPAAETMTYNLVMKIESSEYRLKMEKEQKEDWKLVHNHHYFRFKQYELQFRSAILRDLAANQRSRTRPGR